MFENISAAFYVLLGILVIKVQSRPVSRVLSWTVIPLGRPSPDASSDLPEPGAGRTIGFLFGLAPGGVCHATPVASRAVRSYRTLSPLPAGRSRHRRFAFCCTFRGLAPPRRYLAPCPPEPGLSSPFLAERSDCPADSPPRAHGSRSSGLPGVRNVGVRSISR